MWRADIEVPNRRVDMSSWRRSACYPRSTFYPLSDGHSTLKPPDHYALVSYLLGLSASQSSSLVPLHSTHDYHPCWGNLGKPPLLFWRRPPQSNYPPSNVPLSGLGFKQVKDRISTSTNHTLARMDQSLRPILHITCPKSMLSYSKGSRGLSVPSRVTGIFTGTTISPGSRLRQYPNRYTIRAGRNLPDKEFRYLRTVIVTAAVYRGFISMLRIAANIPT